MDADGLKKQYRMPVSFGSALGPRNLPADQAHRRYEKDVTALSLSARSDADLLAALLPEGFHLAGEPRLGITVMMFTNLGWLAGRGYNILVVRIPAIWRGEEEMRGDFIPVVWESMADPILTGRDELGWSKIYGEIPDLTLDGGRAQGSAAWDGHRFFSLEVNGLNPVALPPDAPAPMMFQKYVPRTGALHEADVSYPTVAAPDGPAPHIHAVESGQGRFSFHRASWEEMPTQYPIVNALAGLPLHDFGPATLVRSSGGGDGSGQRRLR